jgi:hypothetical protein
MKYRIKETIDGNDESIFVVEYEWLCTWSTYAQCSSKDEAERRIRSLQTKQVKYHTVEQ